jgi:hypothetical protein
MLICNSAYILLLCTEEVVNCRNCRLLRMWCVQLMMQAQVVSEEVMEGGRPLSWGAMHHASSSLPASL